MLGGRANPSRVVGARLWWAAGPTRQDAQPLSFTSPDYVRPTPPPRSGYHRYQLLLYEQPAQETITLQPEEQVSLGKEPPALFPQLHAMPRGAFLEIRITP